MESTKELLIILRDYIQNHIFESGLCYNNQTMVRNDLINADEYKKLQRFIDQHRPKKGEKFYLESQVNSAFYWPQGDRDIRIAWLDYHIKKQSSLFYTIWNFFKIKS